jgi:hypothetical protein
MQTDAFYAMCKNPLLMFRSQSGKVEVAHFRNDVTALIHVTGIECPKLLVFESYIYI